MQHDDPSAKTGERGVKPPLPIDGGSRFASEFSVDLSLILTAASFLGAIGDVEGMHSSPK